MESTRVFRSAVGLLMLSSAFAFGVMDDTRNALTSSEGSAHGDASLALLLVGCGLVAVVAFVGAVRAKDGSPCA